MVTPALRSVVNEPVNVTPTVPEKVTPTLPEKVTPTGVCPVTPNTGMPWYAPGKNVPPGVVKATPIVIPEAIEFILVTI